MSAVKDLPWELRGIRLARLRGTEGSLLVYGDIYDKTNGSLLVSAKLEYCLDWLRKESAQTLATQVFLEALEGDSADTITPDFSEKNSSSSLIIDVDFKREKT